MQFPDGAFFPSLTFQTRARVNMTTTSAGAATLAFLPTVVDNSPLSFAYQVGVLGWAPYLANNPGWTFEMIGETATYRLLSCRVKITATTASLNDGGILYVKMNGPDLNGGILPDGQFDPSQVFPADENVPTVIDYQGSLKEGASILVLPLDPTSRRYIDMTVDGWTPPDGTLNLGTLTERAVEAYLEPHIHWPFLFVKCSNAAAATTVALIEIIQDWEVQPYRGSMVSRAARPAPPENKPFIDGLANVTRSIMDAGAEVASQVSVQVAGGVESFLTRVVTGGAGRLLTAGAAAAFSRFAPRAALLSSTSRFSDRFEMVD